MTVKAPRGDTSAGPRLHCLGSRHAYGKLHGNYTLPRPTILPLHAKIKSAGAETCTVMEPRPAPSSWWRVPSFARGTSQTPLDTKSFAIQSIIGFQEVLE